MSNNIDRLPGARALKPCPFCGVPGDVDGEMMRGAMLWRAGCNNPFCKVEAGICSDVKSDAVALWNYRAPLPTPITEGVTCITSPLTADERQAGIEQWYTNSGAAS